MSEKYFEITLYLVGTEGGNLAYDVKELRTVLKDHIYGFPQANLEAMIVAEIDKEGFDKAVTAILKKSFSED